MTPQRTARPAAAPLAVGVAACLLAACANQVQITPMATGQVTVQAYELRGPDLAQLRAEAARRCVSGATVLRESAQSQNLPVSDSRWLRWLNTAADVVVSAPPQAQLVVRCDAQPDRARLSTAATPIPAGPLTLPPLPAAAVAMDTPAVPSSKGRQTSTSGKSTRADSNVPYGF